MSARWIVPVAALLLTGCGEPPETGGAASPPVRDTASVPVSVSRRAPAPLTERDMDRYLAVLEDLGRAGARVRADLLADTLGITMNEGAFAASAAAQRIVLRHGFRDLEHFHQTAYSIAAALQEPANPAGLEAMPLPDDPEERKAMAEIRAAMGEFASTQPVGNAALVATYRDRIARAQAAR